ncbi:MAG TPA: DUF1684 domain-containing protein [Chitinophagaceae bacterium]|jgi:hypothetical protein|nr:DUF1684 domain-containing protein [Chitinophagaceae bacterium]
MLGLRIYILLMFVVSFNNVFSQKFYSDSLQAYIDGYVKDHEAVKGDDKKFLQFFPIDESYRVVANFEKSKDSKWFLMETSGHEKKMYRAYGTVSFTLHDTLIKLNLYQAQDLLADPKYKDYLVLMFTDKTSGDESYDAGRYLDFTLGDIKNNKVVIDFNKAYNPYCAYEKGKYNCPIPPKENNVQVAIRAGEKIYGKKIQ